MADKEATVYIVDVGKSMEGRRHGRSVSDLDWGMTYIWDKITSTVSFSIYIRPFSNDERLLRTARLLPLVSLGCEQQVSSKFLI